MSSSGSNKSGNPSWKYGYNPDPNDKNYIRCNFCENDTKGGINRFKKQLAGIRGDVAPCKKTHDAVKEEITIYFLYGKNEKR
ncbi:hypothetical protein AMTRI_Chr08g206990 [Amborella trichopoda]